MMIKTQSLNYTFYIWVSLYNVPAIGHQVSPLTSVSSSVEREIQTGRG